MHDGDTHPLGYLMYRVMTVLKPAVTAELRPLGLALPEFVCLRILAISPGRTNAELARDTNVSPQAMNGVLRGLQDRGIVKRPDSVTSGRALPAELTTKGKSLLKRAEAAVQSADQQVLAGLTRTEQSELRRLLGLAGSSS